MAYSLCFWNQICFPIKVICRAVRRIQLYTGFTAVETLVKMCLLGNHVSGKSGRSWRVLCASGLKSFAHNKL
jgi:hypothetical protein